MTIMLKLLEHKSFFVLLVFYFFLATFMLEKYPRVWVDEPWESITAYKLATEGQMYNPVLENYSGFDKVFLQPRLVLNLVLAPAFTLLGVGHVEGRIVSVLCGALLLVVVYLFTKKFFSKRAAVLASWFVIIETMIFISYRTIRPEIYLIMLETFSLLFFFQGIKSASRRYFWYSGLCAGVALWTHPNAILHVAAVTVLLLFTYKFHAFTSRFSWSFAAAVFFGVLPYLVYVIVNDAHNSFSTFYLQLDNRTSTLAQQSWLLTSLHGEWNRIAEYAQFPYRAPIVLIFVFVWLYSLLSKKSEARSLAIIVGVHAILSFLLIANKTVLYSTSILSIFCILAAVNIDKLLGTRQTIMERVKRILQLQYWRESLAVGLFVLLSVNQLAGETNLLWRHRDCSYTEVVRNLQSVIPSNARVWGSMTFWFGFHQQPFRSQYTYLREVESFKPEFMITGDAEVWGKEFWQPVRERANEIIQKQGTLVAEFPENCYGRLRVYRLKW